MIMQIPGGVLAQRYGTKKVYGLSNGVAAMLSCAIPIAAKINYKTLLGVRLVQGFIAV
jgi:MFS family permease